MVVYTNAEGALRDSSLDEFLARAKENENYKKLLDDVNNRVVAVENKADILPEIERHRKTIIAMADRTVQENKSRGMNELYTNMITIQAEQLRKKIDETVKAENFHPTLVNAVVEGVINISIFHLLDVNKFKESVISALMKRDTVGKINNGPYTFQYDGKKTELSHNDLNEQIKIIFDGCYSSLRLYQRTVLEFMKSCRRFNKFVTNKPQQYCHTLKTCFTSE